MIKLTQLLKELEVRDPNKLIPGKKYFVWNPTWNNWDILEYRSEYSTHLGYRLVFKIEGGIKNVSKYYIKKGWIRPHKEEINELDINNPNPTVKEVFKLYTKVIEKFQFSEIYYKVFNDIVGDTPFPNSVLEFLGMLNKNQLNKIYQKLKQLENGK